MRQRSDILSNCTIIIPTSAAGTHPQPVRAFGRLVPLLRSLLARSRRWLSRTHPPSPAVPPCNNILTLMQYAATMHAICSLGAANCTIGKHCTDTCCKEDDCLLRLLTHTAFNTCNSHTTYISDVTHKTHGQCVRAGTIEVQCLEPVLAMGLGTQATRGKLAVTCRRPAGQPTEPCQDTTLCRSASAGPSWRGSGWGG